MPNSATSSAFVETATKWRATAASSPSSASSHARAERALVMVSSVVNVFDATMNRVSAGSRSRRRLDEVRAVDVGDETEDEVPARVRPQRLVGHDRPEVGAADADVDDVADRPAGGARPARRSAPRRRTRPSGRAPRAPRDDVDAVDDDAASARRTQRGVQHGAVLGDVDLLAGEHRVDPLRQPGLLGEPRRAARSVSSVTRFFE